MKEKIRNAKFIKIKAFIHTHMIEVHLRSLCVSSAYVYDSYKSHKGMKHTHTLIERVDFILARQSYTYRTETHIFTSPPDAHAYDLSAYCCCSCKIHNRIISMPI